jgi:hypothetical protein
VDVLFLKECLYFILIYSAALRGSLPTPVAEIIQSRTLSVTSVDTVR